MWHYSLHNIMNKGILSVKSSFNLQCNYNKSRIIRVCYELLQCNDKREKGKFILCFHIIKTVIYEWKLTKLGIRVLFLITKRNEPF